MVKMKMVKYLLFLKTIIYNDVSADLKIFKHRPKRGKINPTDTDFKIIKINAHIVLFNNLV
jgi:hypothetical protein